MAVTIKDVAKLAGVSISTVSRVVNNSKPVSPEIKRKVLEVIDEIGYKPNEVARSLVTKKSYLIGVVVTNLGNSYVAEMVRGIEEIGKMYNYDILLCSTYGNREAELKYLQLLDRKQVEGMILISDVLSDEIDKHLKKYKKPFVYLSRYSYYKDKYPTVLVENSDAAYEMTNYLINLGHSKIAYVGYTNGENSLENFKIEGYEKAINESELEEYIYISEGYQIQDGYKMAKEIIKDNKDITAVFCSSDELAIGSIEYFYDNNIKVPEQISVAGFGDISIASIIRPKLTTIKEPFYDIGAVAIRRIIKELKDEDFEKNYIRLPFQIEKRESCKKIK